MEIFLDTADVEQVRYWMEHGLVDGVTTNPSIMLKDGVTDFLEGARALASVLEGRPLSLEVTSNDPREMIVQARELARVAPGVVVKIPVINSEGRSCLDVVRKLRAEGIPVNVTAVLSFNQVMLAAKAGATYVSIFAGRVADEGHDPAPLVRDAVAWVERWNYGKILVGSIRGALEVRDAAQAGAHIVTMPPAILAKLVDHKYSRDTVRQFNADAATALLAVRDRA